VARSGAQVAFLAPTELLAEQHFALARERCARHGLRAELLVGSLPGAARARVERELARGTVAIAFGTHALLGQRARFARLALAVIDEQHRFGVVQRSALLEKGLDAHALFMTATPIPRTLGLCLYGDLDVSVLAERPAGRGKLETRWLRGATLRALPRLLAERLERGERAFWVVPRIESATGAIGAKERCERLQKLAELSRHGIELVHGRLEAGERAARIERFQRGASKLLVATTVIEVGVDVSAATAMVIEGADRLGLAQLHQLRGRVGRGAGDSVCFLLGSAGAAERLEFLEREHDGFVVAEEDLRRRGMGDLAGLRQAGLSLDGVGAVLGDARLGPRVRQWIARDPELAEHYFAAHGGAGRERASAPAARHDAG
jgi:ATP-dependent DNA helicase RecG